MFHHFEYKRIIYMDGSSGKVVCLAHHKTNLGKHPEQEMPQILEKVQK